jgi:hypothetical protein
MTIDQDRALRLLSAMSSLDCSVLPRSIAAIGNEAVIHNGGGKLTVKRLFILLESLLDLLALGLLALKFVSVPSIS